MKDNKVPGFTKTTKFVVNYLRHQSWLQPRAKASDLLQCVLRMLMFMVAETATRVSIVSKGSQVLRPSLPTGRYLKDKIPWDVPP